MSAGAGALGVELEKVGHYRLGAGQRPPTPQDIRPARRMMYNAAALFVGVLCVCGKIAAQRTQTRNHHAD
jgi:adenosylcobinamide-phosphate synthase